MHDQIAFQLCQSYRNLLPDAAAGSGDERPFSF